jgi:hypothetical protein
MSNEAPGILHAKSLACLLTLGLSSATAGAQPAVTVKLAPTHPGVAIPADFAGLSYEMIEVLPNNGAYNFRASNGPLIGIFKSLGIGSLRLGGNTADSSSVPVPAAADIDNLFAFAGATSVHVLYTVRLKTFDPSAAAATATYVIGHYAGSVTCIANGNEPNAYLPVFTNYASEVSQYISAINAPGSAPNALFCGPGPLAGWHNWVVMFADTFASTGRIAEATSHDYFGGDGQTVPSAAAGRDTLLSANMISTYQQAYASYVPAVADAGLPYRIEETNSFYNGGAAGASDTFAAALWVLDYMQWWAANGARGLNFHTSDTTAAPWYSVFTGTDGGYSVRPMAYGIKAFDLGGHGKIVPSTMTNPNDVDVTAYGVLGDDGSLYVTAVNKTHDDGGVSVNLTLDPGPGYQDAVAWTLESSGGVAATSGVTLGGSAIGTDGTWNGASVPVAAAAGNFSFALTPASAAVVRLSISPGLDAGSDAGVLADSGHVDAGILFDAGQPDAASAPDAAVPEDGGAVSDAGTGGLRGGCGCETVADAPALMAIACLFLRRRRAS